MKFKVSNFDKQGNPNVLWEVVITEDDYGRRIVDNGAGIRCYRAAENHSEATYPKLYHGIESGYVCKLRDNQLCEVKILELENGKKEMVLAADGSYYTLYNQMLKFAPHKYGDIMEIYGYAKNVEWTDEISTKYRCLKWKRPEEPKGMTVNDIEEILGYEIRIRE